MSTAENHLIDQLPRKDRLRLLDVSQPVPLVLSEVICEPRQVTRSVYFPVEGFISLVVASGGHPGLEVGMVGREGMLGLGLVLGVSTTPLRALVQGAGWARCVGAAAFRSELRASAALQQVSHRYLYVVMDQLAASAACLRYHAIEPRLARWLLLSHDRAHVDSFHVTHEFLAYMLGVRRVGITMAAGSLQRNGLIRYHRGELTVLDRAGLEAAACSCYAAGRQSYAEVLG